MDSHRYKPARAAPGTGNRRSFLARLTSPRQRPVSRDQISSPVGPVTRNGQPWQADDTMTPAGPGATFSHRLSCGTVVAGTSGPRQRSSSAGYQPRPGTGPNAMATAPDRRIVSVGGRGRPGLCNDAAGSGATRRVAYVGIQPPSASELEAIASGSGSVEPLSLVGLPPRSEYEEILFGPNRPVPVGTPARAFLDAVATGFDARVPPAVCLAVRPARAQTVPAASGSSLRAEFAGNPVVPSGLDRKVPRVGNPVLNPPADYNDDWRRFSFANCGRFPDTSGDEFRSFLPLAARPARLGQAAALSSSGSSQGASLGNCGRPDPDASGSACRALFRSVQAAAPIPHPVRPVPDAATRSVAHSSSGIDQLTTDPAAFRRRYNALTRNIRNLRASVVEGPSRVPETAPMLPPIEHQEDFGSLFGNAEDDFMSSLEEDEGNDSSLYPEAASAETLPMQGLSPRPVHSGQHAHDSFDLNQRRLQARNEDITGGFPRIKLPKLSKKLPKMRNFKAVHDWSISSVTWSRSSSASSSVGTVRHNTWAGFDGTDTSNEKSTSEDRQEGSKGPQKEDDEDDPCLVKTAQDSRYWSGRFMAMHDHFLSDMLTPGNLEVMEDVAGPGTRGLSTTTRKGIVPEPGTFNQKIPRRPIRNHLLTAAEVAMLSDYQVRSLCVFRELRSYCVTEQSFRSLWNWQQNFAREKKEPMMLPLGGSIRPRPGETAKRLVGRLFGH